MHQKQVPVFGSLDKTPCYKLFLLVIVRWGKVLSANWLMQVQHILLEMQETVLHDESIPDKQKAIICTCLADSDKSLVDGSDEALQLLSVISTIQQVLNNK